MYYMRYILSILLVLISFTSKAQVIDSTFTKTITVEYKTNFKHDYFKKAVTYQCATIATAAVGTGIAYLYSKQEDYSYATKTLIVTGIICSALQITTIVFKCKARSQLIYSGNKIQYSF